MGKHVSQLWFHATFPGSLKPGSDASFETFLQMTAGEIEPIKYRAGLRAISRRVCAPFRMDARSGYFATKWSHSDLHHEFGITGRVPCLLASKGCTM